MTVARTPREPTTAVTPAQALPKSLIDLGSGIAVTSVGNAASRVVEAVREQVGRFTHTCIMITPYEGSSRSAST